MVVIGDKVQAWYRKPHVGIVKEIVRIPNHSQDGKYCIVKYEFGNLMERIENLQLMEKERD